MSDTKVIAATVRAELKKLLPDWKFSVTIERYSGGSSINLNLMEGPEEVAAEGYAQLNPHSFGTMGQFYGEKELSSNGCRLTPKGWEVMKTATQVLSKEHWDESDMMIDYFHCNFYMHIGIGKWNRDYRVKEGKK